MGEAHTPVHLDLLERRHLVRAPQVEQLGRAVAATIIAGVLDKEFGGHAHCPFYIEGRLANQIATAPFGQREEGKHPTH